ncbi:uncharacterized protein N7500_000471 [Penicillium coprophilum]|uniref:uncharacterized protein n=1 Tax=Penicillium coprophilum TaxID=36646 RepID=UPI002396C7F2|nr:uncharacterized protein N7500_000471 [Penicillium coprophilum]KAJ5177772.1 hypothetical protein N7500_000471 [Penicillium coprophilum]
MDASKCISEPIFIGTAIRFVNGTSQSILGGDSGPRLMLFAAAVYMGIAVSGAIYQHQINRLRVMVRGALVGLIHHQSLHLPDDKSQDSSALALISSDIDSVDSVGCSRMSAYVAKHLENRQKDWNAATQNRLAATSAAIEGIKSLKMMGMEDAIQSQVLYLRNNEIQASKRLRWILVAYNASANALGILAPVLTLVLFLLSSRGDGISTDQTFTALALLAMVTHPANMVMTLIPQAISVLANFDRIQTFISQPSIQDTREVFQEVSPQQFILTQALTVAPPPLYHPILCDLDLAITKGEIVTCAGAVGSGKTTLAMAVLGEATTTSGLISISSKEIAYCAQEPWLPSVTIREAIAGHLVGLDIEWYNTVIEACGLVPDFHSFVAGDMALIENNGMNLSGGQKQRIALARAVYSKYKMLVLDDPFSALDEAVAGHIVQRLLGPRGLFRKMATTVLLISNSISDRVLLLHDSRLYPRMHLQDPKAAVGLLSLPSKNSHTLNLSNDNDSGALGKSRKLHLSDAEDDTSRRTGDVAIYGYYINAIGRSNNLMLILCTAGFSFCSTFAQYVLKWATESPRDRLNFYISLYATISFIGWVATSGTMWAAQMKVAIRSGALLHAQLLDRILRAPLSYITKTDIGTIVNRFGQDINLVDKQLPPTLANLNTQIFKLLMQLVLLVKIRPMMSLTVPVCAICVYFIQRIYLRTSRQLRFLELESKSSLLTNFMDTANGIVTIRAFGWKEKFQKENVQALDLSQKPFYLLLCLQCWLKMMLDCIITGFAVVLIAFTISYRNTTAGADLGLALNLIIVANTTLLKLVQSWTSFETSLGAISRLKSIQDCVPTEYNTEHTVDPGLRWPSSGNLHVNGVSVGYTKSSPLALRNISFVVKPGQKTVVVGRTGSGKSTLMLSLLQLLEPSEGSTFIDDISLTHMSPRTVRKRGFIAVPQDGLTIPTATLRFNLDPYHTSSEEEISLSLQRTGLWDKIQSMADTAEKAGASPKRSLLDLPMLSFLPLSAGQLQLLALSRTLLRVWSSAPHKPIVILDEVSSSLDSETESILIDILRDDLRDYTVVIIAHRVAGIMGAMRPGVDAIATMQDGRLQTVSIVDSSG